MLIKIGYDITLSVAVETAVIYCLRVHPSRRGDLVDGEHLRLEYQGPPPEEYEDIFGNVCGRLHCLPGPVRFTNQAVVWDSGLPDDRDWGARQLEVWELPHAVQPFLLGSRYCECDSELLDFAWTQFGGLAPGLSRVQAVVEFVHRHLRFDYLLARSTRTALEAYRERVGVCRDFTHLAVTLCRCLNIPARYVTGYLGDIGVPPMPAPMDFSAWMEVYVGGRWFTFDPRHNAQRIGRIVMAKGRDAADVAITTVFGNHGLQAFHVTTEEVAA